MSITGLSALDDTLHTTNTWLKEIGLACRFEDRSQAYRALRATLHALRDRLPLGSNAHFSAQLPLVIRGVYFEGWSPLGDGHATRQKAEFLAPIAKAFCRETEHDPEVIAAGVFSVIRRHVSAGEIDHILHALPKSIRVIFD